MSEKKYIVRLTDSERKVCSEVISKLKGTSQKVRRAQILLKADADGPAWTDARIAEAYACRTKTVENLRQRFVESGFEQTLDRKQSPTAGAKKLLDGNEEAKIIAMRLGSPPDGYGQWTLRLLARKVVELEIVEKVSHETVRQTLKKIG
ncbi:helix-turn-helix domain-containing protein [Thalassoroseus pseudoceratinae]|uniref:helix-turn-helix domain-containing protein n=1 Tax=Thalassoroseus pseudoceratinae TaxID=2713176 RepID=UPI00142000BC|nr:helix-turn-helix domain-containing protein [Thalassoroseus pseudoceratinae]